MPTSYTNFCNFCKGVTALNGYRILLVSGKIYNINISN